MLYILVFKNRENGNRVLLQKGSEDKRFLIKNLFIEVVFWVSFCEFKIRNFFILGYYLDNREIGFYFIINFRIGF